MKAFNAKVKFESKDKMLLGQEKELIVVADDISKVPGMIKAKYQGRYVVDISTIVAFDQTVVTGK